MATTAILQLFCLTICIAATHCTTDDAWRSLRWDGKLVDGETDTMYCQGDGAYMLELCQNREYMANQLFAADILGYCKYDWWTEKSHDQQSQVGSKGDKRESPKRGENQIPGLDADFTNEAKAVNTYLYAVRTIQVEAISDVWLCSDQQCDMMQDVGFTRDNSTDLNVFTASTYWNNTMAALPLAGKPANLRTYCEAAEVSATPRNVTLKAPRAMLCFTDKDNVTAPSDRSFIPVMIPAYAAAAGVTSDVGPYGRLRVGTYKSNVGCVRLVIPSHTWLLDRGWNRQHDCVPESESDTYIFISYFVAGWADAGQLKEKKGKVAIVENTTKNLETWEDFPYWWRYARALWCDDDAMSSSFSGARCYEADMSYRIKELRGLKNNDTETEDAGKWLITIEGIPVLAFKVSEHDRKLGDPGMLAPNPTGKEDADYIDYSNRESGRNPLNSTHAARWLFSADMLARVQDKATDVPWCFNDYNRRRFSSSNKQDPLNWEKGHYKVKFENGTKHTNGKDLSNCQLLDSQGLFTLNKTTQPTQPFHTLLKPGLIAWDSKPRSDTLIRGNMGFAHAERLPPEAIVRATLEAVTVVQHRSTVLAEQLLSTADMTATRKGAFLNLFAFSTLAIVVWFTAADFVKVIAEDIVAHRKQWIWVLYVFPSLVFFATLMPAPVLALLQEINARKNNPDGDVEVGFMQVMAKGYGDYHLMVFTAYKSTAKYTKVTLGLAWTATGLAALGVVFATCYAVMATNRLWKTIAQQEEEERLKGANGHSGAPELGQYSGEDSDSEKTPLNPPRKSDVNLRSRDVGRDVESQSQDVLGSRFTDVGKMADGQ